MAENLPLVASIKQPVNSMEPGTNVDDQPLWNGTTWVIAPQTSLADPLIMSDAAGVVAPGNVTRGVLYKQAASDGLWWLTDGIGPLDLTAAAVAAPHAPISLDLFVVNPALPAVSNNYTTVATAMTAALLTAPTAAAPAVVHITPGTYNEAITLRDNIYLVADAPDTVILTQTMDSVGPGTLFGMRNVNVVSAAGPALQFPGGSGTSYFHDCTFLTSDAASAAVRLAAGTQLAYFDNCQVANTNLLTSMAVETVLGSAGRLYLKRCVLGAAGGVSYDNEIRQSGASVSTEWSSGRVWFTATTGSTVVQFCNFSSGATANPMFNVTAPATVFAISNSFFSGPVGVTGSYATGTGTFQYGGNTLRTSGATNNVLRTVTTDLPYVMDGDVADNATAEDLSVLTVNPNKPESSDNYQTIAAAYAAAVSNQTIMVTSGIYNEDLTLTTANVTIRAFDIRKAGYSVLVGENNTWTFNAETYIHGIDFSGASGVNPRLRLSAGPGWAGIASVVLYYCRIDSGAVPVSAGTDWTANNDIGAVRITFTNCGFNSGGSLRPAIDVAQDNSIAMGSCSGSGIINHTSTGTMTMSGGSWSGHVLLSGNLVALGVHARFTNVNSFFPAIGQTCIQSSGDFQNIWIQDCFMGSDPTAPAQISVTGANCLLEHGNLKYRPRTLGADANDTILVTDASSSVKLLDRHDGVAATDLGVFLVNPNLPETENNYQTIQAAVLAAEAAYALLGSFREAKPTVLIAAGHYNESNIVISEGIVVKGAGSESAHYTQSSVIVDGNGFAGPVFVINAACVLENLMIKNTNVLTHARVVFGTLPWSLASTNAFLINCFIDARSNGVQNLNPGIPAIDLSDTVDASIRFLTMVNCHTNNFNFDGIHLGPHVLTLENCPVIGGNIVMNNVAGSLRMYKSTQASGNIVKAAGASATNVLARWSSIGQLDLTDSNALLYNCVINTTVSPSIDIKGTGTLEHGHLTFVGTAKDMSIASNDIVHNDTAGANEYIVDTNTVGPSYYQTVQAAVTAAEAVVVAATQTVTATVQLNSTTIIGISDADNALISVGDIIRGSGLSTITYAWVVTKNNEGANANTIVTTQHGITGAVATTLTIVSLDHDPVVLLTPGVHDGDVTVSQRLVLKGSSREDTVLNGQLTIASACTVRDLTVSNNDSAVVVDAAYDSTADYYFYDCYVYSTDTVTLNPVLDLTAVTASANPRMYLIRSNVWRTGGVGDVAVNLNETNRMLCENSSFIGIINLLGTGSIRFTDTTVSGGVFLTGAALGAPSTVVFMTRCSISSAALTCLNMDRANANATLIDTLLTGTGGAAQSAIDITAAATASYARLTFGGTNDTIDLNGVGTVVALDITPTIVP